MIGQTTLVFDEPSVKEKNEITVEVLNVKIEKPKISADFEKLEEMLRKKLSASMFLVDEDSVKAAKLVATEINKLSGEIKQYAKQKIAEMYGPIAEFEEAIARLVNLCQETRSEILSQTKVFEDQTRAECLVDLENELEYQYDKIGVTAEFRTVQVHDLVIISNKTLRGLSKKAIETIVDRVIEAKRFQELVSNRRLTLEGTCLKAGLMTSLTETNISSFIYERDESVYTKKLFQVINNEIARQKAMEEAIIQKEARRIQAQADFERKAAQEKIEQSQTIPTQPSRPTLKKYGMGQFTSVVEQKTQLKEGEIEIEVMATFKLVIKEKQEGQIESQLVKRFADAGFKTVPKISHKRI